MKGPGKHGPVTGKGVETYAQPIYLTQEQARSKVVSLWGDSNARADMTVDLYKAGFIYSQEQFNYFGTFVEAANEAMYAYQIDTTKPKGETQLEWLARKAAESDRPDPFGRGSGSSYGGGGGGYGGGGSTTRSIVNLTNEFDAEALVNNALGQYLGRDASEQEISEFWKKLNKKERKNPVVVTADGQSGGFNPQLAAEKFAEQDDEYADTQVNLVLRSAMEDAIRGRLSDGIEGML